MELHKKIWIFSFSALKTVAAEWRKKKQDGIKFCEQNFENEREWIRLIVYISRRDCNGKFNSISAQFST